MIKNGEHFYMFFGFLFQWRRQIYYVIVVGGKGLYCVQPKEIWNETFSSWYQGTKGERLSGQNNPMNTDTWLRKTRYKIQEDSFLLS